MKNLPKVKILIPKLPSLSELQPYIERIDNSKIYSNYGPLVCEFESRLAQHFNISLDNISTCSNATDAIEGAIKTSGGLDKKWEVPSWTFTATAAALVSSGVNFCFRDIDESQRIRLDPNFRNIIEVLPFGESIELERYALEVDNLIFDAAASFDALTRVPIMSSKRFAAIVSLHATKTLSTSEGAIFISNDNEWVKSFRRWTNFGMWGSRNSESTGSNSKMNEYSGAIGLASLDMWPELRSDWLAQMNHAKLLAEKYGLSTNSSLTKKLVSPYWILRLENAEKVQRLIKILDEQGIEWRRWWEFGCHVMPAYSGIAREELHLTEKEAQTSLGLPLHLNLTDTDWERIEIALKIYTSLKV
jgi:dTDP-4-amino-4,6-dideoxygalactose transaminase